MCGEVLVDSRTKVPLWCYLGSRRFATITLIWHVLCGSSFIIKTIIDFIPIFCIPFIIWIDEIIVNLRQGIRQYFPKMVRKFAWDNEIWLSTTLIEGSKVRWFEKGDFPFPFPFPRTALLITRVSFSLIPAALSSTQSLTRFTAPLSALLSMLLKIRRRAPFCSFRPTCRRIGQALVAFGQIHPRPWFAFFCPFKSSKSLLNSTRRHFFKSFWGLSLSIFYF